MQVDCDLTRLWLRRTRENVFLDKLYLLDFYKDHEHIPLAFISNNSIDKKKLQYKENLRFEENVVWCFLSWTESDEKIRSSCISVFSVQQAKLNIPASLASSKVKEYR